MANSTRKRCFGVAPQASKAISANAMRMTRWIDIKQHSPIVLNTVQTEAMAHLLPLLLCGEQSAQLVFNHEISRLSSQGKPKIIKALKEVESDECRHDIALQLVADDLPYFDSIMQTERQAKRFYTGLGRVNRYSEHFVRIATLDTCVTQIMHAFEHCKLGNQHAFTQLCGLIKKDEATHVYVSRHRQCIRGNQ